MNSKVFVIVLVTLSISSSVLSASLAKTPSDVDQVGKEFNVLQKVYDDCQDKEDFGGCLKTKASTAIERAVDQDIISLLDGISLVKTKSSKSDEAQIFLADARGLSSLSKIDQTLIRNIEKFLNTHTIKVDFSEARGKEKKHYRYVIAAVLTAMGIAGPLGLKALAFIAGKALVISKVALTIAGIIALKKIFSSDHHEETSFQVHAGSDHNRRNAYLKKIVAAGQAADPFRYYYEQPLQNQM
ncbi:CLUMA_CG014345, isoform A [Clunio marinus]|uniref:CLUMA_CG014345, isoform A n=1 Tax=Clunio marinus TaxID=568069 RepID=A0A1J1IM60_9DIPT|nr:CLUMA_CG014345, isoform A [Clunio marinus]